MRAKSLCAALVLAAAFFGLIVNSADACWWHHHCHRCQSSSYSRSAPSSSQSPQALTIGDILTIFERIRPTVGDSGGIGAKIDALTTKVDALAGLVDKVEANTVEIDRLKTAHEAFGNSVSNDYVTKVELDKAIGDKIDAKLKVEFEKFSTEQDKKYQGLSSTIVDGVAKVQGATHRIVGTVPFSNAEADSATAGDWKDGQYVTFMEEKLVSVGGSNVKRWKAKILHKQDADAKWFTVQTGPSSNVLELK